MEQKPVVSILFPEGGKHGYSFAADIAGDGFVQRVADIRRREASMSYVICKDPGIRMDMMVKKKYAPQLVGYIRQKGCTYTREIEKKNTGDGRGMDCSDGYYRKERKGHRRTAGDILLHGLGKQGFRR